MSQLIVNGVVTMSSRDIADLVQSKHSDVKRSAERLVAAGILTAPLAQFDFEHNGNVYQEYRFNKRDSLVIVARLSPEFTAAVVDRWQELEEGQSVSVPRSLPEALRLAADLAEQKEQLTIQLAAAAPKVEFVDRYCSAKGSMSFRQVAKLLNAKETEFRLFLIERNILYRLGGTLTPWRSTFPREDLKLRREHRAHPITHSARRVSLPREYAGLVVCGLNILQGGRRREGFVNS